MIRILFAVIATAIIAMPALADPIADSLFARGNKLFDAGRYAEAADMYRSIEDAGYSSSALDINLGLALQRAARPGEALFYFTRAARRSESTPKATFHAQRVSQDLAIPASPPKPEALPRVQFWIWIGGAAAIILGGLLFVLAPGARRRPGAAIALIGCVAVAASIGWSAATASVQDAMIVRGPATIYDAPGSLVPIGAPLFEGERVRIVRADGPRVHVQADDGRTGWIDLHRVREF